MKRQTRSPRPAFTILELLIIISIIALLMAISVSAVFRLQEGQRETNTTTHLRKIQMVLDQQWKAATDQVRSESNIPTTIYNLTTDASANRDQARAKAVHMKLRLRREFPQTYAEVQPAFTDLDLKAAYGGKPAYVNAIAAGGTTDQQSAALLYLILSTSRGGATTNPDELGPTQTIDIGGKPMKVLVDEWGQPIAFRRWATDNEMTLTADELNSPPFVNAGSTHKDPQDPEGRLKYPVAQWPSRTTVENFFKVPLNPDPGLANPFDGKNRGPFIVSAGRDETFTTVDDLFSFRIAQTGKGN